MMASISEIRLALAETISAGVSSPLYTYAVVEEMQNLPAALVEPVSGDFNVSFNRGSDIINFNVFVLVSRADPKSAQTSLDNFISGDGPDSLRRAIYDRSDLGLDTVDASVLSMKGYGGSLEGYGIPHIGAVLQVRVLVNN